MKKAFLLGISLFASSSDYCFMQSDSSLHLLNLETAVHKLDPLAFKQALDKIGPLSKHVHAILLHYLTSLDRTTRYEASSSEASYNTQRALRAYYYSPKESIVALASKIGLFISLLSIGSFDRYCNQLNQQQKYLAKIYVSVPVIGTISGFSWLFYRYCRYHQKQKNKKKKIQQERQKIHTAVTQMLEILDRHPIEAA